MDKQHEEIVGATIEELQDQVNLLKQTNKLLTDAQLCFRDQIAMRLFVINKSKISLQSNEQIAVEVYKTVDAFIRVREKGDNYENELIEDIKLLIANQPNNADLGSVIREIYKTK